MSQWGAEIMSTFFRFSLLFSMTLVILAQCACKSSHTEDEMIEAEAVEKALRVAELVTAYTPENAKEQFESASSFFSDKGKENFVKGLLGAQLPAIIATQREQTWKVVEDEVVVDWDGAEHLEIGLHGVRTRSDKNGIMPEETIRYTFQVVTNDKGALVFDALRVDAPGASEAELLEQWEKVSGDASEERDNFRKVVEQVNQDLKAHEVQVDKSFEKLSTSLGALQNRVKDMGEEVKKQKAREAEALRAQEEEGKAPEAVSDLKGSEDAGATATETPSKGAFK